MGADGSRDARKVAFRVLAACTRGQRLDRALDTRAGALSPRDRHWVHALAYGVARLRGRLDYTIALHARRGSERLDAAVVDLLRMGAYQLHYMDGVPTYAAVSSTVELARAAGAGRAAGLINAVLRASARAGLSVDAFSAGPRETDLEGHFTHWHSHPRWLVRRWLARWGATATEALLRHDNGVPGLFFRPVGIEPEPALERLRAAGLAATAGGLGSGCLRLAAGTDPARVVGAVPGVIQDPGAALVARYADPPPGALVADLCAAPGGKALVLSERAGYVLAADLSPPRLKLVTGSALRLGVRVGAVVADAGAAPVRRADLVLVDAPCTGTGTLARRPDVRWRLTETDPARLAGVQSRLLAGASRAVPAGGLLVYSTCTLEPEENVDVVERFLSRHPEFRREAPEDMDPEVMDDRGHLCVLPQSTGFDGAFAVRMRRVR